MSWLQAWRKKAQKSLAFKRWKQVGIASGCIASGVHCEWLHAWAEQLRRVLPIETVLDRMPSVLLLSID